MARAVDVPLPLKPLPKQITWSQLADRHNKAQSGANNTSIQFTAAYEKRLHYAHTLKQKSKKRYVYAHFLHVHLCW